MSSTLQSPDRATTTTEKKPLFPPGTDIEALLRGAEIVHTDDHVEVHELRTYKGKDLAERDAVCHGVTIKAISRPFMGECFTFTVWPGFRWYYQSAHGSWQFDPSRPGNGPEGAGTFNDSAWVSWAPEGSLVGKDATNHVAFKYEAGGSWWNNRNYDLTFTLIINDYSYLDNKGVMSVVITC